MRNKLILGILLMICISLISGMVYAETLSTYYSIAFPLEKTYCNCDDDCMGNEGCLSADSGWIVELNDLTTEKIEEAHENGKNGICAKLFFQTHETPYAMTPSCALQDWDETEDEEAYEATQIIEINEEGEIVKDNQTEENTTEEVEEEIVEEEEEVIEEEPEEEVVEEEIVEEEVEEVQENNNQTNQTQEESKMIPTSYIMAGTTIIMGFFILVGWLSYLLYRK